MIQRGTALRSTWTQTGKKRNLKDNPDIGFSQVSPFRDVDTKVVLKESLSFYPKVKFYRGPCEVPFPNYRVVMGFHSIRENTKTVKPSLKLNLKLPFHTVYIIQYIKDDVRSTQNLHIILKP